MAEEVAIARRLSDYAANPDPLTAASNRLALILAANQPFYPLYVRWVTGEFGGALALTFLSTPFFLASPWVSRRFPRLGRFWFPIIGAINTFFCAFVFGEASGVALFLIPCFVIAALSSRATEYFELALFSAALIGAYFLLLGRFHDPLFETDSSQLKALFSLNAYSAATLSILASWMLCRARRLTA